MGILFCRDYGAEYEKMDKKNYMNNPEGLRKIRIRKFAISVMISFIQTKQEFIHVETLVDIIILKMMYV